jgi:PAS domain S-box-containing protein
MIDKSKLDSILDAFTKATGVASIISDVDGTPITKPFNFSNLCLKYCRATEQGRFLCHKSDSYGGQESARTRKNVIYNCFNSGLIDCAAPILLDGLHVANVLCGQVLESPIPSDIATERARRIGISDIDGYLRELTKIPIISFDRFKAVVQLMEVVTQTISDLAFQNYLLYKRSRRYLEKLINSVTDCIVATNNDGVISMVNDACAKTFCCSKEELVGRHLESLFPDESSKTWHKQLLKTVLNENSRIQTSIGSDEYRIPVLISFSRINMHNEEMSGYVAIMRDITEEQRTEKMRQELLGMLTHDMGNPVLSMQKAMQLLSNDKLGPLNKDQKEIIDLAYQTGNQLYGMVTDFLDTYRHENDQFLLRCINFDVIKLIRESTKRIELFALDKSLSIIFDSKFDHLTVKADRNRIGRVCINLLENAIKYSPEHGKINIDISMLDGKDHSLNENWVPELQKKKLTPGATYLLMSISDEGLGISESDQCFVFDKFFTTYHKKGKGRKGFGLGLTFCKLAVEAHGGQIGVMSPLYEDKVFKRKGCRFSFTIPV